MKVAVVMGSISDMPVMQQAIDILKEFGVETHVDIVSAHRTPEKLVDFSDNAHKNGINVIIAGAGGAAHLPGMVASMSPLPVIGVPVKSSNSIDGWDSVLSILQMQTIIIFLNRIKKTELTIRINLFTKCLCPIIVRLSGHHLKHGFLVLPTTDMINI